MTKKNDPQNNRRQFERLPFNCKMQLFSGTAFWICEIMDISLKGVLFSKPSDWDGHLNETFRLSISLTGSPSISMSIEIAHIDNQNIGAKWNKIDVGSFSRLKRIIELNNLEKDRISREISFL